MTDPELGVDLKCSQRPSCWQPEGDNCGEIQYERLQRYGFTSLFGLDTRLGIWLGGAALALGVHSLSFVPSGPASSSSLL